MERAGDRSARAPVRGIRVLLVEDDPDTAEVVGAMLAGAGADVARASTAVAALDELGTGAFDVVVTDYSLGHGPSGFELLTQIRRTPAAGHLPVIGYSAHGGLVPADEQAAFTAYAAKPLFVDNVLALVRGVTRRPGEPGAAGRPTDT